MMDASPKHQTRKDAVRQYTIHHAPGAHLTFDDRERLARDWNRLVQNGPMPTLRGFAESHGIPFATWRREYNRGKTGETVPDPTISIKCGSVCDRLYHLTKWRRSDS